MIFFFMRIPRIAFFDQHMQTCRCGFGQAARGCAAEAGVVG